MMDVLFPHACPVSLIDGRQIELTSIDRFPNADPETQSAQGGLLSALYSIEQAAHSHPMSRKQLVSCLSRYHAVQGCIDDELVMFALVSLVAGESELINFVVSPAWQGAGIGGRVLDKVLQQLASHAERMFLEVRASNTPAITLYENAGFSEIGVRPNYYPSDTGGEDALLMAMELFPSV